MSSLFGATGRDVGFQNIQSGDFRVEREMQILLEALWTRFRPYAADQNPRKVFANDVDAGFLELALGCRLLDAGKVLLEAIQRPKQGGQPDLCVLEGGKRIWIECVAPERGQPGPDRFAPPGPGLHPEEVREELERQAQLRILSAFRKKQIAINDYLDEGVITPTDVRIIAISGSRFRPYIPANLIMSTLFPYSESGLTCNSDDEPASITRKSNPEVPISRQALLEDQHRHVSGVIWSHSGVYDLMTRIFL